MHSRKVEKGPCHGQDVHAYASVTEAWLLFSTLGCFYLEGFFCNILSYLFAPYDGFVRQPIR